MYIIETLPVALLNLTAQIVSNQMLMMSWTYPLSLLAQTVFEVGIHGNICCNIYVSHFVTSQCECMSLWLWVVWFY